MKTAKRIYVAAITTVAPTATAFAATGAREDTSGLFVWAFLGFCALIVAAQVTPCVLMVVAAVKGVTQGLKERRRGAVEAAARAR